MRRGRGTTATLLDERLLKHVTNCVANDPAVLNDLDSKGFVSELL